MTWPFPDRPPRGACRSAEHYVVDENGCWIWQRGRMSNGYGVIRIDGRLVPAHVYAYERVHGPKPAGSELDHVVCQRRDCVNPWHTEPVTHAENGRRGRRAKITMEDAREIRRLRSDGLLLQEIGDLFGLAPNTVGSICRGSRWAEEVVSR